MTLTSRLATVMTTEEIDQVIERLEQGDDYVFWGNNQACDCDYAFVHLKGSTTVCGILKVDGVKLAADLTDEEFCAHRPDGWGSSRLYQRYFVVTNARRVHLPIERLRNGEGRPLEGRGMHDKCYVSSPDFKPF